MIQIRPSDERGHTRNDWLDTRYTFSFNDYYDEAWSGFRQLRVINDDIIAPDRGFGLHPHRDMEIVTYILAGELAHKDSMGNGSVIRRHDIQRMTAGSGIRHSEFNPSLGEEVHLLQIWIYPSEKGLKPGYEQATFERAQKLNRMRLIASPDGDNGSVNIYQDVRLYASILEPGKNVSFELARDRHAWLQVARGSLRLGDISLAAGDGAAVSNETALEITATDETEFLLFDLT